MWVTEGTSPELSPINDLDSEQGIPEHTCIDYLSNLEPMYF
jgi:hypothetical protein